MNYHNLTDNKYLRECIKLALQGQAFAAPNPMVGCVITKDGNILAAGFHAKRGGDHAERDAISKVTDRSVLKGACLYVNLEPCSHFGRTPPCTDYIIEHGIGRVVFGTPDINPQAGGGAERLKEAGIEVTGNVLLKECLHLNRRFFTFHKHRRPYIILKWAETQDRFIARPDFSSKWISSDESRLLVHRWRAQESGIMVGTTTSRIDNPALNVRVPDLDPSAYRNPIRITIDRNLNLPKDYQLLDGRQPTIVFNALTERKENNLTLCKIDFAGDVLRQIMARLCRKEILSVIVEGGAGLLGSLIAANLWDEARIFRSRQTFGDGIKAPALPSSPVRTTESGGDSLMFFSNSAFYNGESAEEEHYDS